MDFAASDSDHWSRSSAVTSSGLQQAHSSPAADILGMFTIGDELAALFTSRCVIDPAPWLSAHFRLISSSFLGVFSVTAGGSGLRRGHVTCSGVLAVAAVRAAAVSRGGPASGHGDSLQAVNSPVTTESDIGMNPETAGSVTPPALLPRP